MRILPCLLVFISTLILLNCSCKKDPELKPETVTVNGKTFGCRIDNVPFIADYWDYAFSVPPIQIDFWYDPVNVKRYIIVKASKESSFIQLYINGPLVVGKKELKSTTLPYPVNGDPPDYGLYKKLNPDISYITNSNIGGYIDIIQIDSITHKIEARFEFTGTYGNSTNQVKITNGYLKNF